MTKINGINLPDMTERELSVDDIFNENFNVKRKKTHIDYDANKKPDTSESESLKYVNNNNVIDKIDSPQNLKRKSKNFDNYDIDKIVQANMIIGKESDKSMRHCNDDIDYKSNGHLDGGDMNEVLNMEEGNEYSMKNGDELRTDGDDKMMNAGGDYSMNGSDDHGNDVSSRFIVLTFQCSVKYCRLYAYINKLFIYNVVFIVN